MTLAVQDLLDVAAPDDTYLEVAPANNRADALVAHTGTARWLASRHGPSTTKADPRAAEQEAQLALPAGLPAALAEDMRLQQQSDCRSSRRFLLLARTPRIPRHHQMALCSATFSTFGRPCRTTRRIGRRDVTSRRRLWHQVLAPAERRLADLRLGRRPGPAHLAHLPLRRGALRRR